MSEDAAAPMGAPYGHPVVATLAGGAVLVVAALLAPMLLPQQSLTQLLVGGVALGVLLWGIGLAVTTRHAAAGWIIGSLVLLAGAGAGAAMVAHGQFQTRARADASSFAEIEFAPNGAIRLPAGIADRGPISKLYADSVQADEQDARAFGGMLSKFGLAALGSPYLLEQNPAPIRNCAALDGARDLAMAQSVQRAQRQAALLKAIAGARLPEDARHGIATIVAAPEAGDPLLANQRATLATSKALCELLAKRRWYNDNAYFGFRDAGDGAKFKQLTGLLRDWAAQGAEIERRTKERVIRGRDQVRAALSKSIYVGG
jgi:hypothetical protein